MSDFRFEKLETLVSRVKVGFVGSVNQFYCDCEEKDSVPIIRTTDIDGLDFSKLKYVTGEFHERNKKSQLKRWDLIIARHGENGNAVVYNYQDDAQVLNAVIIEPNPSKMPPELLKIYFDTPFVKSQIKGVVKGSVQGVINTRHVSDLLIPISDSISYEGVTSSITSLDAKIELNNKINAELEAMAKLIYDYWFVQFDFPDENGKPYKSSGGKMVYNQELKREIPEGWEVKSLTEEMDVQYGYPFSTDYFNEEKKGKPVIRIRDILNNSISIYSTEIPDQKYRLEKGDLLIGMDGNFHLNFWDKDECYLNQRSVRIRKKAKSVPSHFQVLFDIRPYIQAREKNVSRTTVGHLSAKDINGLKVLIPSSNDLILRCKMFDSILNKLISNRNENQKLSELRDWLLPMLMNGQVKVK